MKYTLIISIVLSLISCGTAKKNESELFATEGQRIMGIVHIAKDNCPLYISCNVESLDVNINPKNLEEKFQREGLRLKFSLTSTETAGKNDCNIDYNSDLIEVAAYR